MTEIVRENRLPTAYQRPSNGKMALPTPFQRCANAPICPYQRPSNGYQRPCSNGYPLKGVSGPVERGPILPLGGLGVSQASIESETGDILVRIERVPLNNTADAGGVERVLSTDLRVLNWPSPNNTVSTKMRKPSK